MKDHIPRIAGVLLLAMALALLVWSPSGGQFSIENFFLFVACLVGGILLITGLVGTHPVAARLRREASQAISLRQGPLCQIPEGVYPFGRSSWRRSLAMALCCAMALFLLSLGFFLLWYFPANVKDRVLMGFPLWIMGLLCLWISFRYPRMYLRVNRHGITLKSLFRTATMRWEKILALVAREHFVLTIGGFASTGTSYSVYSTNDKLGFTNRLPDSDKIISLISEATGLTWNTAGKGKNG